MGTPTARSDETHVTRLQSGTDEEGLTSTRATPARCMLRIML